MLELFVQDNLGLSGWKYSEEGCLILFLNVYSAESIKVMKRYLRANNVSISYDLEDDSELCEPRSHHVSFDYSLLQSQRHKKGIFLYPMD